MPRFEFDGSTFAAQVVTPLRDAVAPFLSTKGEAEAREIIAQFDVFESDVARTFTAIELETNTVRFELLKNDLTSYLPARRAALLAFIANRLGGDAQAVGEVALNIIVKAAVIALKSFVPVP